MLAAVAAGSAARHSCGGCSVHTLEIYHVDNLTDADVDYICSSFHSLRCGQPCGRNIPTGRMQPAVRHACMHRPSAAAAEGHAESS